MTAPATTPDPAVVELLTDLAAVGVRVSPEGPNVRYWSPEPLAPELRSRIIALKTSLLAYLSIWSAKRARALLCEADALVERLGVDGRDQVIEAAAARFVDAQHRHDMVTVRAACHAIEDRARRLAAQRSGSV